MKTVPLNIFQKLMRRWEAVHPYNAAQVMKIIGSADLDRWSNAWRDMLIASNLGRIALQGDRYRFEQLNGHMAAYTVRTPAVDLETYLSTEINRPFADPHEPPFRPFIIQQDGFFYAGMVYQHWLADSCSIRTLMHEWFVRIYDPGKARARPIRISTIGYWDSVGPGRGDWPMLQSILDLSRRHIRMRRVQKIESTALDNHNTAFKLVEVEPGLIDRLRDAAHQRDVKINDIFLAALVQACALHIPMQRRKKRHDVAVGSVVDLRPWCPEHLKKAFGVYLGFTNVICQPTELIDFDRTLQAVSRQTRLQKTTGVAPQSLMWMTGALCVGSFSKPAELYHFYRKELPLAGGLSNVDLSRTWPAEYHPGPLLDYIRVSPTGPMTPLAVTTTTLGDQFHIGLTYRVGLISPDRAGQIAAAFVAVLKQAAEA
jgi:hypothetical protein